MANNHGGRRAGSGRKKMPVAEKILNGKMPKEEGYEFVDLTASDEMAGCEMPEPNDYLLRQTKGATENKGAEIYKRLWAWLEKRDCHLLINPELLQQYSLLLARYEQAENAVHEFGFLAKHPTTGLPIESPFSKISMRLQKQSAALWAQIEVKIAERVNHFADTHQTPLDPMDYILMGKSVPSDIKKRR